MAYGIKYKGQFKTSVGHTIMVNILKKDYNSAQIDLRFSGVPVTVNYLGNEEKYDIIRGSECVLELLSENNQQYQEIMISDAFDFQVQVFKNNILIWQGYVIQDNYSEPFQAAPYVVSIRATDGLGNLKLYDFQTDSKSFYLADMTLIEVLQKCLSKLKNASQLVTSIDVFESRIDRGNTANEALNKISVNPYLFIKDDLNALKCDVVLQYILEVFNCYIYYKNDKYYIERVNYKVNDNVTRRTYNINPDGSLSNVVSVITENITGVIGRNGDAKLVNADANLTYQASYNIVQIDSDVVNSNNILVNSFFRNWDNTDLIPYNWLKIGTFTIAKLPYTNTGDAIRVTQKSTDAQLSYTTNMLKAQGVNFRSSALDEEAKTLNITIASVGNARFMVKANSATASYYLECTSNDTEENRKDINYKFEYTGAWKTTPTYCKIERGIETRRESGSWFVSTIGNNNLPSFITSLEFALLPSYDITGFSGGYRVREFTPSISNGEGGSFDQRYTITSTKTSKETYTDLAPAIGEFENLSCVNQTTIGGEVTANWYRDGRTEAKSLLQIASQSILNQYRTGFVQFEGSLRGTFDFSKVYSITGLSGKFMPYKASIDLKSDISNVGFFELLSDADDASDVFSKVANYKDTDYTTLADPSTTNKPRSGRGSGRN